MKSIRIAIAGVGNCASSLVQGIEYYSQCADGDKETVGLLHPVIGGYTLGDIAVVAAFDIDARKVGKSIAEAIFAPPNNAQIFQFQIRRSNVTVQMGPILDGLPAHMESYPPTHRFEPSDASPVDIARSLRDAGAEILVNYLPVGSQRATETFAQACLDAGVCLVNCIPVFIASDKSWADKFRSAGIPCVGDDVKSQVGSTIVHRALLRLFNDRGVRVDSTYQLNTGGNTDFLNMLDRQRLKSKKISKTDAVQSQLDIPLHPDQIHVGPSDFVPFQKDGKVAFIRIEATGFGGVPLHIEARLSVQDSPNSAGVVVDAIRCCKLARDHGLAGPIDSVSAWTMKHPPRQMTDAQAGRAMEQFISRPA